MAAKADETLDLLGPVLDALNLVLGALNLVLGGGEWRENLHEVAHRLVEALNRFGQRGDRSREGLDHLDVVLDRLRSAIDRSDRIQRFVLGLLQRPERVLIQRSSD